MPDWQKLVHERFTQRRSGAEMEPEVTEELAHYLEDFYEAGLDNGLAEHEATQRALAEVGNWPRLARNIQFARNGGEMLKQRVQTLWMPGFVAAIVAVAASIAVNRVPSTLFGGPHVALFAYGGWLLILMGVGAFAACWSRAAGGSTANRTAAALLPAVLILAALGAHVTNPEMKVAGLASIFSPGELRISGILPRIVNSMVGGILLPAVALLAGALPFLRGKSMQHDVRTSAA
jgi:hypothetical protein